MACYSNGGASKLTVQKQTSFNNVGTVGVGTSKILPFISASPDVNRSPIIDPSLTGNREEENLRLGGVTSTLDLEVAHRFAQYDDLLEASLNGTWTANALEVDSDENPLCFWLEQQDIVVSRKYENMVVNTMSLSAALDSVVTLNFGMTGTSQKLEASADTAPIAAIATAVPYMHFSGVATVNGVAVLYLQQIDVNLSNDVTPVSGWGSLDAICVATGKSVVDLTISAQHADSSFMTLMNNETEFALEFTFVDGIDTETWTFDRCRVVQDTVPVSEGQVLQSLSIKALRDTVNGQSAIKITRT